MMEYGRTKALAMEAVVEASRNGLDAVTCCPSAFLGPPDYRRSPMGGLVLDYLNRKLPAYVTGGFDFVDVRDVAAGIIAAATRGRSGGAYLLAGRYITVPELMEMLQQVTGVPKPRVCLPTRLTLPFTPVVEAYYRATGRSPRFTRYSLQILTLDVRVDASRAGKDLGYTTRPLEETIADLAAWYRSNGYVSR
jgi:dihydroflavonol-4-reductase